MKRRLLNLLTALSLLLCVAVVAMWVRGLWVVDRFYRRTVHTNEAAHTTDSWVFTSGRGVVSVIRQRHVTDLANDPPRPYRGYDTFSPNEIRLVGDGFASKLGFHWFRDSDLQLPPEFSLRGVRLPYWLFFVVTATPPALWARHALFRRRHRPGMCPACGYDLRATPGRCPECGRAPAANA